MQEHAIPQDVTGYKFHIVGDMTLGQFAQLVLGAIIAFGIYSTNLFDLLKWILIFFVVILSVVGAFIPIAERPLSHWIKTFFQVLYRPTQYAWKRIPHIPEPFLFKPATDAGPVLPELDLTPLRRRRIQEFISTTRAVADVDDEAQQVEQYYNHVFSLFSSQSSAVMPTQEPVQVNKPSLRVRTRSMRANPSTPLSLENALNNQDMVSDGALSAETVAAEPSAPASPTTNRTVELEIQALHLAEARAAAQSQVDSTTSAAVEVPTDVMPTIDSTVGDSIQPPGDAAQESTPPAGTLVTQQPRESNVAAASSVTFNKQLPFPSTPTTPNKLVGMILTPQNELIEGAIIEIQSPDGQVLRAVRSNALGQFYVTTPLTNGSYSLVVEKTARTFEPLSITLKGKIVDPIEIRSVA